MEYKDYKEVLGDLASLVDTYTPTKLLEEQEFDKDKDAPGKDDYIKAMKYKKLIIENSLAPYEMSNFNNVLVGPSITQLYRGMRSWGEELGNSIPVKITDGLVRAGDFVMVEHNKREGQGMGKPLARRWDGTPYANDISSVGKAKAIKKIIGVVQFSDIIMEWNTKDKIGSNDERMVDVDCAITGKFIYLISHGKIQVGDLVEASAIKIKMNSGHEYIEHGVKPAKEAKNVIGVASSFGLSNPKSINVTNYIDRQLVLVRLRNVL